MGVGMKLWLLIIGTILVYITVSNDAKSLNGDMIDGNPTSLVEEQEGMVRVKRAAGARKGKSSFKFIQTHSEEAKQNMPKNRIFCKHCKIFCTTYRCFPYDPT